MADSKITTSTWKDSLGFTLYLGNIDKTSSLLIPPTVLSISFSLLKIGSNEAEFLIDSLTRKENIIISKQINCGNGSQ